MSSRNSSHFKLRSSNKHQTSTSYHRTRCGQRRNFDLNDAEKASKRKSRTSSACHVSIANWHSDLSQRCGKVENESCGNFSFQHYSNVVVRRCQDVVKTLPQRRYNINQWLYRCFLVTDNWQFFPYFET